jgi:hypothetical protein
MGLIKHHGIKIVNAHRIHLAEQRHHLKAIAQDQPAIADGHIFQDCHLRNTSRRTQARVNDRAKNIPVTARLSVGL